MKIHMTEKVIGVGSLVVFFTGAFAVGFFPQMELQNTPPSEIARRRTPLEERGRHVYIENGCTYCHTQYIRPQDQGHGAVRVAQMGDYVYDYPSLLGSERTGPDLSQEGGLRPDDWHMAHFFNPRYTRPASEMPQFKFLFPDGLKDGIPARGPEPTFRPSDTDELTALVAYLQSLGGRMADARVQRMNRWRAALQKAYARGEDDNFAYLHTLVPQQWRTMPNPYSPTPEALERGRFVYFQECVGCHGNFGDGNGPAARFLNPRPANFSALRRMGASGGLLYYQIMNGITGSAMMSFKHDLESEKIWDVSNYVAVNFIGASDGNTPPRGVDEIEEPVDPNAPGPPDPDTINVPPPTSPALQADQNGVWHGHGPASQGGILAAPDGGSAAVGSPAVGPAPGMTGRRLGGRRP